MALVLQGETTTFLDGEKTAREAESREGRTGEVVASKAANVALFFAEVNGLIYRLRESRSVKAKTGLLGGSQRERALALGPSRAEQLTPFAVINGHRETKNREA